MPSAGRPKVSTRLDPEILEAIKAQLVMTRAHATLHTILDDEIATFVERAIIEKLAKMRRSREGRKKSRGRCQAPPAVQGSEETVSVQEAPMPINPVIDRPAEVLNGILG